MRVYGPYTRKDSRQHVILIDSEGNRVTKSYPRYIMEMELGRVLLPEETVDHINGDFTNNSITNLQLLALPENIRKSAPRAKQHHFICPNCGIYCVRDLRGVKRTINSERKGPFCSKSCAGRGSYTKSKKLRQRLLNQ